MKSNVLTSGIWYSILFAAATVFAQYLTSTSLLHTVDSSSGINVNNLCLVAFFLLIGIFASKLMLDTLVFMQFPPLTKIKSAVIFILCIYAVTAVVGFFIFINKSANSIDPDRAAGFYFPISAVVLAGVLFFGVRKIKRINFTAYE